MRRRAGTPGDRALTVVVAALLLWIVLVFALLVWEPAMWRAHIAAPGAATRAARGAAAGAVVGARCAGLVVAGAFFVSNNTSILWPDGYTGHEAALVKHLERFPSDAQFISDDPGLVWRSGHDTPGDFADTSYQRLDDHSITDDVVGRRRAPSEVCGVIVTSPMHFGRLVGLADVLAAIGFHPVRFGEHITLYQRGTSHNCPFHG